MSYDRARGTAYGGTYDSITADTNANSIFKVTTAASILRKEHTKALTAAPSLDATNDAWRGNLDDERTLINVPNYEDFTGAFGTWLHEFDGPIEGFTHLPNTNDPFLVGSASPSPIVRLRSDLSQSIITVGSSVRPASNTRHTTSTGGQEPPEDTVEGGKRRQFSVDERQKVARVRRLGACIGCRIQKQPVRSLSPFANSIVDHLV